MPRASGLCARGEARALGLAIAGAVLGACSGGPIGTAPPARSDREAVADRVRGELVHAWSGYRRHAWGHDELKPISQTAHDWYAEPLLMTSVDTLDTLILAGLTDEADAAREHIASALSFDVDVSVQQFEITIRLLGGLLSAHQLTGDARLLALADDLGRRLLPAFDSPTGMPYRYVNLRTGAVRDPDSNPAEIGTLMLEFGTLARLTGKPIYYDRAKRAVRELFRRRSKLGLVGEVIDVETGAWERTASHVGARIDSYYEYLLKSWRLFGDRDFEAMWKESIAAVHRHVADTTGSGLWYGAVDMESGRRVATESGALEAFFPAVLVLGGDFDRARRLHESSYLMWTRAGLIPDGFDYRAMKATAPSYPLRPEIIESTYYLHRATGDPRYLAMGRRFLDDLVARCRTGAGYAALKDVGTGEKTDSMPSFFTAETLKYLYLLFAPDDTIDLDAVVFTTEAHPLRRTW
jgi:ER degradation enhancer, mannosidase alpha-like 2